MIENWNPKSNSGRARIFGAISAVAMTFTLAGGLVACSSGTTSPPTVAPLDEQEAAALIQEQLDRDWAAYASEYPDDARPTVTVVRAIDMDEWAQVMPPCMADQGFKVTIGDDGGMFSGDVPLDQAQAYQLAKYVCGAQYPYKAIYSAPLNDSQIRYLFDYYTGELTQCLRDQGREVNDAPSWARFEETFGTGQSWHPYQSLGDLSSSELAELSRACPQNPDHLYG